MIRFRIGKMVGFGLSEMNVQKLKEGLPIYFEGESCGVPGVSFYILYGETERALVEQLRANGLEVPEMEFNADGSPARRETIRTPEKEPGGG